MRPSIRAIAIVAISGAALSTAALATTLIPLTIEDMARASSLVVRATTISVESRWDQHRRIVTTAHVVVSEVLAGDVRPGEELEVYTLGGEVGGVGMAVVGAPRFEPSEDDVLFLLRHVGTNQVVGLGQGKFEISLDATGGTRLGRASVGVVEWLGGTATPRVPTLDELRDRVRRARGEPR